MSKFYLLSKVSITFPNNKMVADSQNFSQWLEDSLSKNKSNDVQKPQPSYLNDNFFKGDLKFFSLWPEWALFDLY
jgi:hypothetical protein